MLAAGTALGPYKILAPLGAGGMGEVYLAEDPKHHRQVAIKVLSPEVAATLGSERFLREIEIAAKLTHPHILPVHDSGSADGLLYYVMPFVEGESLRQRLQREKQLPVEDALRIAREVADALNYAHSHRVVHRDIKPENILLESGHAVVADFGIARAVAVAGGEALTQTGVVVGTPAYMSPEQAAGSSDLDGRSDLYSLGCVLYEMLAGQPPFAGPTAESLARQHIGATPQPVAVLRPAVPPSIEAALTRALAKSPADRFADAARFVASLEAHPARSSGKVVLGAPGRRRRRAWAWAASGLIAVAVVAIFGARWFRGSGLGRKAAPPSFRQLTLVGRASLPALSPDGKSVAYVLDEADGRHLMLLDLAGGQPLDILGPARRIGTSPGAIVPAGLRWSPDGSSLLAAVFQDSTGALCVIPRLGGASRPVGHAQLYAWSPDGTRLVLGNIWEKRIRIQQIGTDSTSEFHIHGDFVWLHALDWSADRDLLLVLTEARGGQKTIWTIRPDGRGQHKVASGAVFFPQWTREGRAVAYLVGHDENADLYEVEVAGDGTPRGKARLVLTLVRTAGFSIARDGTHLAYTSVEAAWSQLWRAEIRVGDRTQPSLSQLTTARAMYDSPSLSPDGRQVAFCRQDEAGVNLYVMPASGGAERPVTFGPGWKRCPAWSPDGRELAFVQEQGDSLRVWRVSLEGGPPHALAGTLVSSDAWDLAWAPGSRIVYVTQGNRNLQLVDPATGKKSPLLEDESNGWIISPCVSPDGSRLLAFWNNVREGRGLWVFGLKDGSRRRIAEISPMRILGWSSNGGWIYVQMRSGSVLAVATDGETQPRSLGDLSTDRNLEFLTARDIGRGRTVMFGVRSERPSDIWLVSGLVASGR